MRINKVAFIGKGGVGLLYGSMIARVLGDDAVEFVMDDARYERHAADQLRINGEPCSLRSVSASEATPADLVILTIKTTGLNQALDTMEAVVGPETRIGSRRCATALRASRKSPNVSAGSARCSAFARAWMRCS